MTRSARSSAERALFIQAAWAHSGSAGLRRGDWAKAEPLTARVARTTSVALRQDKFMIIRTIPRAFYRMRSYRASVQVKRVSWHFAIIFRSAFPSFLKSRPLHASREPASEAGFPCRLRSLTEMG